MYIIMIFIRKLFFIFNICCRKYMFIVRKFNSYCNKNKNENEERGIGMKYNKKGELMLNEMRK